MGCCISSKKEGLSDKIKKDLDEFNSIDFEKESPKIEIMNQDKLFLKNFSIKLILITDVKIQQQKNYT